MKESWWKNEQQKIEKAKLISDARHQTTSVEFLLVGLRFFFGASELRLQIFRMPNLLREISFESANKLFHL
jgi:hypothetical protein